MYIMFSANTWENATSCGEDSDTVGLSATVPETAANWGWLVPSSAADTGPDDDADAGLDISLDKLPTWSAAWQLDEGTAICSPGLADGTAGAVANGVVADGWGEAALATGSTAWSGVCDMPGVPDIGASGVLDRDIDRGVCERDWGEAMSALADAGDAGTGDAEWWLEGRGVALPGDLMLCATCASCVTAAELAALRAASW